MEGDYYGLPTPAPEPNVTALAAPSKKPSSCQDSCCDSDDTEHTPAPGQKTPAPEKLDDCCSPEKCTDNKSENHTDAPDCCRGKVSPCCDTSYLDRLAIQECEMSAMAAPGPNSQPNSECPPFENGIQRLLTPFQLAVELPTTRHTTNIVSLPSTATALLYRLWDVSTALLLLLARKPAVKFATDSH